MRRTLLDIVYVLLTAYILVYFSEWMFWSGRPDVGRNVADAPLTWLFYGFVTFLFLAAVDHFRVRRWPAIFLAGALYGWMLEGIIVQTMYNDFPFNISFTGLAWHALISVCFGWALLPRWLRTSTRRTLIACAGYGLFLGLWSVGWWGEVEVAAAEVVLIYNSLFTALLIPAYLLWDRLDRRGFHPRRGVIRAALIVLALYYVVVAVPVQPLALIVLPPMLALAVIGLERSRRAAGPDHALTPPPLIPPARALLLAIIPLLATGIYALFAALDFRPETLIMTYCVLMPAGFILFALSLRRAARC